MVEQIVRGQRLVVIPLPLANLNDVIAATKRHWSIYAQIKRSNTDACATWARKYRPERVTGPSTFRFTWHPADYRVDPDNLAHGDKYILDGLVAARVMPDDKWPWVSGITHVFGDPWPAQPVVAVSWEPILPPPQEEAR